jgi:GT2 family glycosyltransferase
MESPDISVVIPALDRLDALERCIAALVAQDFPRERFEIIVADGADETRVRQMAGRWAMLTNGAPLIRYVPAATARGPAGARNLGWRAAKGDVIAFTNDASVPRANWLTEGWKAMSGGATAAAGVVEASAHGAAPEVELDGSRAGKPSLAAANCFVQRQALRAVGGFDERFTAAWDDARDLQFTLAEVSGELVSAPAAIVERPGARGGWDATLHQYRKILFDALLFKKHPRLYRERIRSSAPWSYYAIVAALAAIVAGALTRTPALAWTALFVWTALTVALVERRLRGPDHGSFTEVVATSVAIPPIAIFWRLAGALRFRVFFL